MADNAKLNKDISLSALYFPITKLEKNSVPSDTDDDIMEIQAALEELEMKKRLKGLFVSVIVITILIWVLGYVLSNFATIMGTLSGIFNFAGSRGR